MNNRQTFNIDVSKDEDGKVDVSLTTNQDFRTNLDFDDVVNKLESVFDAKKKASKQMGSLRISFDDEFQTQTTYRTKFVKLLKVILDKDPDLFGTLCNL